MTNTASFFSTYISITYISVIFFRVTNIDVNLHKAKYPNQYNATYKHMNYLLDIWRYVKYINLKPKKKDLLSVFQ